MGAAEKEKTMGCADCGGGFYNGLWYEVDSQRYCLDCANEMRHCSKCNLPAPDSFLFDGVCGNCLEKETA